MTTVKASCNTIATRGSIRERDLNAFTYLNWIMPLQKYCVFVSNIQTTASDTFVVVIKRSIKFLPFVLLAHNHS